MSISFLPRAQRSSPRDTTFSRNGVTVEPVRAYTGYTETIALANNARLAAALDDLGIAGGEFATALGLGPLTIDGQLRWSDKGHEYEVDAVQNVIGLVTAPRRRAAAHADLAAPRARASSAALELAARTEMAFGDFIAAQQVARARSCTTRTSTR